MIKSLFFLLIYSLSFGHTFVLSNKEKRMIKAMPNKKVVAKRFSNFYKFLNQAKVYNLQKKLIRTNLYINKIRSKIDGKNNNNWSTPKEFLINGYGDCEDYAIAKYFTLLKLGIDERKLFLSVVKVKGSVTFHMVLIYMNKNTPFILDNLSWKVLPLSKRKDLIFQYAFNKNGSYKFKNKILIKEVNIKRGEVELFKRIFLKR